MTRQRSTSRGWPRRLLLVHSTRRQLESTRERLNLWKTIRVVRPSRSTGAFRPVAVIEWLISPNEAERGNRKATYKYSGWKFVVLLVRVPSIRRKFLFYHSGVLDC